MASQKQIDANRRNALKSTGPKTPEGKAAVSLNALKHGLTAQHAVVAGEDIDQFDELLASYEDHLRPVGPIETLLVQQLVMAAWRLTRVRALETGAYELRLMDDQEDIDEDYRNLTPHERMAYGFLHDARGAGAFTALARLETRIERSFYRALHELQHLQAGRPKQPDKTNPIPDPQSTLHDPDTIEVQPHSEPYGPAFHNTLTQKIEEFSPLADRLVRMYTCGPTVWNFAHIGNLRTFTFQDILRRWLTYRGYRLDHVMNLTDVDDRIIQQAAAAGKSLGEYTDTYARAFREDTDALRLQQPEHVVRATDHIQDMVALIQRLAAGGHTYESEGSVYFRVSTFPSYGKLSHTDFKGILDGARVDTDKYDKENARDFVLWKARKEGEHYWDTPLGPGRPGWHIECSAMSMKYLGETLDIHAGGVDLTFPHHENEIAQSEAATGKPFARFWLHSEHLMVEGQTMSKTLGNFYTLRDLIEKGYQPETVRYLLAAVPYRKQLNFTFDGLKSASTAIERLRNFKLRLETERFPEGQDDRSTTLALRQFEEALDDDLNTAEALGAVFEYVRDTNTAMDAGQFKSGNVAEALDLLARFDGVFDVLRPTVKQDALGDTAIDALIAERTAARKARDFARADQIRSELLKQGVILEDTKDGIRWKRK